MKQPIVKSNQGINYFFNNITDVNIQLKDSCSFDNDMVCTNTSEGGIVWLKKDPIDEKYKVYHKFHIGKTYMWAPTVFKFNNSYFVLCSNIDENSSLPWWKTQNFKWFWLTENSYTPTLQDFNFRPGVIDPELFKFNGKYYISYVVMDWNNGEWWDIYVSESENLFGPYTNETNISQMTEYGIEEAPFYNSIDGYFYWSVKSCDVDSFTRRGKLKFENGKLNVEEDSNTIIKAFGSPVCTHPDYNPQTGKLRATLRDPNGVFYIGEMES